MRIPNKVINKKVINMPYTELSTPKKVINNADVDKF